MPYKDPDTQREYNRLWVKQRKEEFFKEKSCAKCGSKDSLELDHIDPSQKISHSIWSWSKVKRDVELEKCQVLCNPCHKEKSELYKSELRSIPHGSGLSGKRNCKCPECKKRKTEYMKTYRRSGAQIKLNHLRQE